MERAHDDDDNKSENRSPDRPVPKILNLRSIAERTPEPAPVAPLAPAILRAEGFIPPTVETGGDDGEDDEDDEEKKKAKKDAAAKLASTPPVADAERAEDVAEIPEVPLPIFAEATDRQIPLEATAAEPAAPAAEFTPPAVEAADEAWSVPETAEPWRPVPLPPRPPVAARTPRPPAESSIFDRKAEATASSPTRAAAPEASEPVLAWEHRAAEVPPTFGSEPISRVEHDRAEVQTNTELRKLRESQAAVFLLEVVLAAWLNHKINKQGRQQKREHKEITKTLHKQAETNAELTSQVRAQGQQLEQINTHLQSKPHKQAEQFKTPAPVSEADETRQRIMAAQMAAEAAHAPEEPRYHVEHSWYDEAVDREGHVVEGVVEHGRAYYEEKRVETAGNRFTPSSGQSTDEPDNQQAAQLAYQQAHAAIQSSQVPPNYALPSNMADPQHLLEEPSRVKNTLTDPWVWVGLAVLLFAFFTAAFI